MAYKQVGIIKKNWRDIKPPLGSVIDWENPLARGLVGAWLMNEGAGKNVRDLSKNRQGTITNAVWNTSLKGSNVLFSDTAQQSTQAVTLGGGTVGSITKPSAPFTVIIMACPTATIANSIPWSNDNSAAIDGWYLDFANGGLSFTCARNTTTYATTTPLFETSLNTWYFIAGVEVNSALRYLYVNGNLVASNTTNNTPQNTITSEKLGGLTWVNEKLPYSGKIAFTFTWNRVLSPSEIQSLYIAPYQMIAPIVRRTYIQVGGEPPVTNRLTRRKVILSCN